MITAVNTTRRLRLLIFVQTVSVALIAAVTILKGRVLGGRLEGMLGGNYSNSNDLALAMVISLPLCLGLLFLARNKTLESSLGTSHACNGLCGVPDGIKGRIYCSHDYCGRVPVALRHSRTPTLYLGARPVSGRDCFGFPRETC